MNKTGIVIILLCFLAAAAVVLWERRKTRKTMEEIERMLDAAMTGSFSETNFDESQLSALETKFAHYLSAAEASSRNVAQEKDKIKTLIADISHQTKTPIANLLLYSELLMEETMLLSIDIAEGQTDKPDILLLNELDHFFWRVLHVFTCFLSFRPYVCRSNFFISGAIAARKLP